MSVSFLEPPYLCLGRRVDVGDMVKKTTPAGEDEKVWIQAATNKMDALDREGKL